MKSLLSGKGEKPPSPSPPGMLFKFTQHDHLLSCYIIIPVLVTRPKNMYYTYINFPEISFVPTKKVLLFFCLIILDLISRITSLH